MANDLSQAEMDAIVKGLLNSAPAPKMTVTIAPTHTPSKSSMNNFVLRVIGRSADGEILNALEAHGRGKTGILVDLVELIANEQSNPMFVRNVSLASTPSCKPDAQVKMEKLEKKAQKLQNKRK